MTGMLIGSDEAEVQRRLAAQLEMFGMERDEGDAWLAARRDRWVLGTPEQASAGIAAFEAVGIERLVLQTFVPRDLEMIRLAGQLVADRATT
jgi:alkanesulfonate monooxygenase SsuD/methylene tetrahydromethanopterin reductase-like flavin-dependent oxidoreductase (luciferase family)